MADKLDREGSFGENLYLDTRGSDAEPVPFTRAVIDGLAPSGGLYVPERIPHLPLERILELADLPYSERAAAVYRAFNIDLPDSLIDELMGRSYGENFNTADICPIHELADGMHMLQGHGAAMPAALLRRQRRCAARARSARQQLLHPGGHIG